MNNIFLCPICKGALHISESEYICPNKHSFDRAKSGYVNLLLSQKSTGHGDDKRMIAARRSFLDKGYFNPLLDVLCESVLKYAVKDGIFLDAGCGEGFYTAAIEQALLKSNMRPSVLALDISKAAISSAAKRSKTLALAVASVFHLPVGDNVCDMLLTVFAPFSGAEFQRVLKKNGILVMVIPLESHLWDLKCAVYDKPYKNEVHSYEIEGFSLLEQREVKNEIHLPCNEDIQELFTMTPYYYKTGARDQEKLQRLDSLDTQTAFAVLIYGKK